MDVYRRHPSTVAQWKDGALQPLDAGDTEVWFALPREEQEEDQVWEALNARTVGEGVVELLGVPALADLVAYGDRVSVVASAEGPLVATGLVGQGTFGTFRVWLGEDADAEEWRRLADRFARRGCLVDVYSAQLLALACPTYALAEIRRALEDSTADHADWEWEESTAAESGS